jgi:hypothetical protein
MTAYVEGAELMDALRQEAVAAGTAAPAVRGGDWRLATVSTVAADGTITTSDGVIARRLDTYRMPQAGDVIQLTQSSNGNWLAVGRTVPTAGDAWQPITLVGTWAANGGGNDPAPAYRVTSDGELRLSGMIKGTAVAVGAGANIGTIPNGTTGLWVRGVGTTSVAQDYVRIDVSPTGSISMVNGSVALLATSWVQLDGVRGRAR